LWPKAITGFQPLVPGDQSRPPGGRCSQLVAGCWLHYHEPMSLPDLIFIFLLALVIIGPKKMPGLARQLGKFMAEFKRASNEFKNQLETEMMNIELEERAKKPTDSPKVLPPDEPWERLMRPLTDSVSRTRKEFETIVGTTGTRIDGAADLAKQNCR
jgi:Sec-independent protein translocase protein TatA